MRPPREAPLLPATAPPAETAVANLRRARRALQDAMRALEASTIDVTGLREIDQEVGRVQAVSEALLERLDVHFETVQ